MATQQEQQSAAVAPAPVEAEEFAQVLKGNFKPRTERAATEVENAIQTLVTQALAELEPRQGRSSRHDRRDDRASRREAFSANERSAACSRVPATRERLARAELSRVQFRNRRDAQDPRAQRRKARALSQPQEQLPGRAVGPEPALQIYLRERVRHARRRALWGAGRRLCLQPFAGRRAVAARSLKDRLGLARPACDRRRSRISLAWIPGGI